MHRIIQVIKLDFLTVKSSYSRLFMIYLISLLIGVLTQPFLPIIMIMFFCVSFSGLSFSITEKNKCEKLYGILPVCRKEAVIGRYFYGLLTGIANLIISIILAYLAAIISKRQIEFVTLSFSTTMAFCYFCFSVSISYPIFYKFSFFKSYIFITLPLYLIILLFALLSEKTNLISIIDQGLQFFFNYYYYLFLILFFLLSIIMLIISAFVSYVIFKDSEL